MDNMSSILIAFNWLSQKLNNHNKYILSLL